MSESSLPLIHVSGAPYEMGLQHGRLLNAMRPAVVTAMTARAEQVARDDPGPEFEGLVEATIELLQRDDPAIVEQIYGIADGLMVARDQLLRYSLVPFLRDVYLTRRHMAEGCTTWAASAPLTADGGPILVKNRDYTPEHAPLQVVVRAEAASGYRTTYLTSAGSPGVFVAGCNETGLSIVDTHVPSLDVGPGLPAYALAMHVLEEHSSVRSALSYLQSAPRLGRNNFVLADSSGDVAAFEMGNQRAAVCEAAGGFVVNTNHFNSPEMRALFVDTEPPPLQGNSFKRYERVGRALQEASGEVDVAFARTLMSCHAGILDSICRHPTPQSDASTIAMVIFLPRRREMHVSLQRPCEGAMHTLAY